MSNNELIVDYRITSICDSHDKKGHVEVMMEPVEELEKEELNNNNQPPTMVQKIPFENPQMMMQFLQDIPKNMGLMQNQTGDMITPQAIIHIEDAIEFQARGWKHGDILTVSIKKKEEK